MSISGKMATRFLESHLDKVSLFRKDNTDKFWSYKLRGASRCEFAFDPNTTTKLVIRFDVQPPSLAGVTGVERIEGRRISTALGRIFSGGTHVARYKATIADEATLLAVINALG